MSFPVVSLLVVATAAGAPFWGRLEPGGYGVGFEEREYVDHSRPFRARGDVRSRVVPAYVWYPSTESEEGKREAFPFGRYVTGGAAGGREQFQTLLRLYGSPLSDGELARVLETPTNAQESARPAPGRFPILLVASGLTAPVYLHAVLSEYLASHGYVVVALPTLPASEGRTPGYEPRTVDTQMRDMELVLQQMHDDPRVDVGRIGLVGWSVGGVAQALLQMKNPGVQAVVSLDGATGYAYGLELLEASIFFEPARARAPFLHATDARADTGPAKKSFRYFDEIVSGPAYLLTLPGLRHSHFTSLGGAIPGVLEREEGEGTFTRYELLCLYVRHFLAEALSTDREAKEFLSVAPTRHGFEGLVLSRKR